MKAKFFAVVFLLVFSIPAFSKNIAVLPFQNLTQDADKNWIGAGFSETLTTKLGNVKSINMVERQQLTKILDELKFQMAGYVDEKTAVEVGKMYGVDVLVLGSYQLMKGTLRVSARFVDVETGKIFKTAEATGKLSDIFSLQDKIAFNLMDSLNVVLAQNEKQKVKENPTENLTAYEWFGKGDEAYTLKLYDKAIKYYTKAIELDDHFSGAYNNRGIVYYDKGNYDQAIKDYDKAIALNPNNAEAYNNRGIVYYDEGNYDQAIQDYDKAIEIDDHFAAAYNNRGTAYVDKGDYEQAIKDYEKAIAFNPKFSEAYYNHGLAYARKGDYDTTLIYYTKAITINPKYAEAYNNRGNAYGMKGNYDQAIKDYDKTIELKPKLSQAYTGRGFAYSVEGNDEKAKEDFKKAADLGDSGAREALKKLFNNENGVRIFYRLACNLTQKNIFTF